jgi:CHRD domain
VKKSIRLYSLIALLATAAFVTPTLAQTTGQRAFATHLTGYDEAALTINTTGSGDFKAVVSPDGSSIMYRLTFQNLSTNPTQSHIHIGKPAIVGGVVLFLCTNLTPPANVPTPPPCPTAGGTVTGMLTAADVIAVSGQGVDSGVAGFAEIIAAMGAGATYANVHSTRYPGGEIRGRVGPDTDSADNP